MPIVSLRDLYIAELQDLYDVERQVIAELPGMAAKATSADLKKLLERHLDQTRVHAQRLELICQHLGVKAVGRPSEAIGGLVAEARRRLESVERGEVLDAAIVGAAQRIEHYEIAAYGCARTYARTLAQDEAAHLLQQTLEEEGTADHELSRLAERGINQAAGEETVDDRELQQARLRYVQAGDLPEFRYREFRVRNAEHDDLGSLDGFVLENRTRRPLYAVIDSGGWFVGRRYLVPVGALQADEETQSLRTGLSRETLESYPEFNASAFLAMDDDEAVRYERRLLNIVAPGEARTGRAHHPSYDELEMYSQPTWLMTGIWMTEGSGFAAVPPRAESDAAAPPAGDRRSREAVTARGESERPDGGEPAPGDDVRARDTDAPKSTEPGSERYRER